MLEVNFLGLKLKLAKSAKVLIAKNGFNPKHGARPLNRLIQEKIKKPLAEELLFGKLVKGGNVFVDNKKDENLDLYKIFKPELSPKKNARTGSFWRFLFWRKNK